MNAEVFERAVNVSLDQTQFFFCFTKCSMFWFFVIVDAAFGHLWIRPTVTLVTWDHEQHFDSTIFVDEEWDEAGTPDLFRAPLT
ncbi:hypothetical protein D3C75_886610 [compost metagenome]